MGSLEEWISWHESIKEQVGTVYNLLKKPLSDEPEALIKDLQTCDSWNARAQFLLADCEAHLSRAKAELKPPKEFGAEFDRRIQLEADTSSIRCSRDKLEALCESLKQRLIAGSSMLAYHRQFKDHGNMR